MTWFLALGALVSLTYGVRSGAPLAIDFALLEFIQDLAERSRHTIPLGDGVALALLNQGHVFDAAMVFVSVPGNGFVMTAIGMGAAFAGLRIAAGHRVARTVLVVNLAAVLINLLVYKPLVSRLRPTPQMAVLLVPWQNSGLHRYSFPSGHTVHYMVLFGLLAWWAWNHVPPSHVRNLLVGVSGSLVLLVGISRVYLGAHWPTDVLAGYLVGYLWLGIGIVWIRGGSQQVRLPCA